MDTAFYKIKKLLNSFLFFSITFYSGTAGTQISPVDTSDTPVRTNNGTPVVDIATPSASGVSQNRFDDFNVDRAGVVINNSLVDGNSALAGAVNANANFNGDSARIILNEVVSTRISNLLGQTELFGDNASYILANPNGISCDGCGFFRTPTAIGDSGTMLSEVLLSTGTASVDSAGIPLNLTVARNSPASIVIGPGGLDASNVDVTTLFTRQAQIRGVIDAANQLQLLAGTGTLAIENNVAPEERSLTVSQSDDNSVFVAIDAQVAGAMSAGQIYIRATEEGVGVALDNDLMASNGDIEITANGDIRYRNASASDNLTVTTNNAAAQVVASGESQAGQNIRWNLAGNATVAGDSNIIFSAGNTIDFNCLDLFCEVRGLNTLEFIADTLQTSAALITTAGNDLMINAAINATGDILSGNDLFITTMTGNINAGLLLADNSIFLHTEQADTDVSATGIRADNGSVVWQLFGNTSISLLTLLSSAEQIQLQCIPPLQCQLNSTDDLQLSTKQLLTDAAIVTHNGADIAIDAALTTDADINSAGQLNITANEGDISSRGLLGAAEDILLTSAENFQIVLDGTVRTAGDLYLLGDGTYIHDNIGQYDVAGKLAVDLFALTNNSILSINDFKDRTLRVNELNNHGLVQSDNALLLKIDDVLNNTGVISSLEGVVNITHSQTGQRTGEINNSGFISAVNLTLNQLANSTLIIDPRLLLDQHIAAILRGEQRSANDLNVAINNANQQALENLTAGANSAGTVELHADIINNTANGYITGNQILFDIQQLNNLGGLIAAANNINITGDSLSNDNVETDTGNIFGVISARDNINVELTDTFINAGIVEATDVSIKAPVQTNNNSGFVIDSLAGQTLSTQAFIDRVGQLAWFSAGTGSETYFQTRQTFNNNPTVVSDLNQLTRRFLNSANATLANGIPVVGDDIFLATLLTQTIGDSGGLPFVTNDRNALLQLGTLYSNTIDFMTKTDLVFGQLPNEQQRRQLSQPIVVFTQQTLPNLQQVYIPTVVVPEAGADSNTIQAQQLSSQIIAYNELLLRGQQLTNRANLVGGEKLTIETVDLTQSADNRNWYVDADGDIHYLSAKIEAPALAINLTGDYVQEGGQLLSQSQLLLQADNIDIRNIEINDRVGVATVEAQDIFYLLARERANYGENTQLISTAQSVLQAGDSLHMGATLRSGGEVNLLAEKAIDLSAADIRSGANANLSVLSRQGSVIGTGVDLRAGSNLLIQAGADIALSTDSTKDTGRLEAGTDTILNATRDLTLAAIDIHANENIALRGRHITLNAVQKREEQVSSGNRTRRVKRTVRHDVADITAGAGIAMIADGNLTTYGSQLTAGSGDNGNIILNAKGDMQLLGVNNEDYSYYYRKKKKSWGRKKVTVRESRDVTLEETVLTAGGNLFVNIDSDADNQLLGQDSGKLVLEGSRFDIGKDAILYARDSLNMLSGIEYNYRYSKTKKTGFAGLTRSGSTHIKDVKRLGHATLSTGGDSVLLSGGEITVVAGQIEASNIIADAGFNEDDSKQASINIIGEKEALATFDHKYKSSFGLNFDDGFLSIAEEKSNKHWQIDESYLGSVFKAAGDIDLNANTDINIVGSELLAGRDIALQAERNVNILAAANYNLDKTQETVKKIGIAVAADGNSVSAFAGLEEKSILDELTQNGLQESFLQAGNDIRITAAGTINQVASDAIANNDISYQASENINVTSDQSVEKRYYSESLTRLGIGVSVQHNYEQTKQALQNAGNSDNAVSGASNSLQAVDAVDSFLRGPTTSAFAGITTTTISDQQILHNARGSNVQADGNINLQAGKTAVISGSQLLSEKDITINAADVTINAANNYSRQDSDFYTERFGITASGQANSASVGFTGSFSEQGSEAINTYGSPSLLHAGGDTSINAEKDITITSSDIVADRNIALNAGRDVLIGAQAFNNSFDESGESGGAEIGVSATVGQGGAAVGVYVGGNYGASELQREGTSYHNSRIDAGNNLTITSTRDTQVKGAAATAKHLTVEAGRNLTVASIQDTGNVEGEQFDVSGRVTVGTGFSASAAAGYGQTRGEKNWVTEQTRLIGSESVTVNVAEHTQLDGAVIANIDNNQDAGNLTLTTKTLDYSDIRDRDTETAAYLNVSASYSDDAGRNFPQQQNQTGAGNTPQTSDGDSHLGGGISGYYNSYDRKQINRATIGKGSVTVLSQPSFDVNSSSGINRDIARAQEITRDNKTSVDLYLSDSSVRSVLNPEDTAVRWKDNALSYADNTLESVRSLYRGGLIGYDVAVALGDIFQGRELSGVVDKAFLSTATRTAMWQIAKYLPEQAKVLRDAELHSVEDIEKALLAVAQTIADTSGLDRDLIVKALIDDLDGISFKGATDGQRLVFVNFNNEGGTSISDSGDISNTLSEELAHIAGIRDHQDAAYIAGIGESSWHRELGWAGLGSDQGSSEADRYWVLKNRNDPLIDANNSDFNAIDPAALQFRQLHGDEIDWIKNNAKRFAEMLCRRGDCISVDEARSRLLRQAFRQVQYGAEGEFDEQAYQFMRHVKKMWTVEGDADGPYYMFYATPAQKININTFYSHYINHYLELQEAGVVLPGEEQILSSYKDDAAARQSMSDWTVRGALGAGALVLAPIVGPAMLAEAGAFAKDPISYCLTYAASCTAAAEEAFYAVGGVISINSLVPAISLKSTRFIDDMVDVSVDAAKVNKFRFANADDITTVRTDQGLTGDLAAKDTVAAARTDIKGLENKIFGGVSPAIRKAAGLKPLDEIYGVDRAIKAPYKNPLFTRHAEENVFNALAYTIDKLRLSPAKLQGKTVSVHISRSEGVCEKCFSGLKNESAKKGVIKIFSERYPDLTVRITAEGGNAVSKHSTLIVRGGKIID